MSKLPKPVYFNSSTPPNVTTLVLMAAVASIPLNMFLAALPEMAVFFDVPYAVVQWTVTGFLLISGVAQIIIGPLSDRYGRRPVILVASVIFILASIGAAMAETFTVFITLRCIQAAIVAGIVSSRAAIRDMVAREEAASLIGYVTMGMALAPMMAPPVGGYLADLFGWQSVFYSMAIIGAVSMVVIYRDFGETNQNKSASFVEQFHSYPELLRSRRFWGYALTAAFAAGTFFAYLGGAPYVGSEVYGLSPTEIGLYLAITPIGYMIGNAISGRFAKVLGIPRMILLGCLITLLVMTLPLALIALGITNPLAFFGFTFSIGMGNGIVLPSANAGLLDVKPKLAGSAAGLGGALMTFGGAGLSALSGAVMAGAQSAYPLVFCILGASAASLAAGWYTTRLDRQMRMHSNH